MELAKQRRKAGLGAPTNQRSPLARARRGSRSRRIRARKRSNRRSRGSATTCVPVSAANAASASSLIARPSSVGERYDERLGNVLGRDLLGARQERRPSARRARRVPARVPTAAAARPRARAARSRRSERLSGLPRARSRAASTRRRTASELSPAPPSSSRARGRGTVTTQVEAIEQRPRELVAVRGEPRGRAGALGSRIAARPARAEVHRRDELEARREDDPPADARDRDRAVLERLAQAPRARSAGTRPARRGRARRDARGSPLRVAATEPPPTIAETDAVWCGARNGAHGHERPPRRKQPGDGVDARHLERLVRREPRQDPGQAPGEHRLAGPGRAGEQQVVTARRRELERAPRPLLAAHIREIGHEGRRLRARSVRRRLVGRRRLPFAAQVGDRLRQVPHGHGLDPGERRLGRTIGSAEQPRQPRLPRALGGSEHAADRAQPSVERQLADRRVAAERLRRNLPRRGQHRERDRQVEARPLLPQLRGREVDRDPPRAATRARPTRSRCGPAPSPPGRRGRRGRRSRTPARRAGGAPRPRRGERPGRRARA